MKFVESVQFWLWFMDKLLKCFPKPSSPIMPHQMSLHPYQHFKFVFIWKVLPSLWNLLKVPFLPVVHGNALGYITWFRMHRQLYTMSWWVLTKYARFDSVVHVIGFVRAKSLFANRWLAWLVCLATSYLACFHHLLWYVQASVSVD